MKVNIYYRVVAIVASTLFITSVGSAQTWVDPQTNLKPIDLKIVNPPLLVKNADEMRKQNSRHIVKIAVIDTGVDYTHPVLRSSIHFLDITGAGQARIGWDFMGNDGWPAPFIARSATYHAGVPAERADQSRKAQALFARSARLAPALKPVFNPRRAVEQEVQLASFHGTSVAAVASYARPDIGILAYRLDYPSYINAESDRDNLINYADTVANCVRKAVMDGADIINLSFGEAFPRPPRTSIGMSPEQRQTYATQLLVQRSLAKLMRSNPHVLFVIAAGNDGQWFDGKSRRDLVSAVKAGNVLLVGAIDESGRVASFSNLPLIERASIYAVGSEMRLPTPRSVLHSPVLSDFVYSAEQEGWSLNDQDIHGAMAPLAAEYQKSNGLWPMWGTSFSAPLVARAAAILLSEARSQGTPLSSGTALKAELMKRTKPLSIGPLKVPKLLVKVPMFE